MSKAQQGSSDLKCIFLLVLLVSASVTVYSHGAASESQQKDAIVEQTRKETFLGQIAKQGFGGWKFAFLSTLFAFTCVVAYEAFPRFKNFWNRKFPPRMCSGPFGREYFTLVCEVTRRQLLAPPPRLRGPSGRMRTEVLLRRLIGRQMGSRQNDWPNSCLAFGLSTSVHCFGEAEDIRVLEKYCDKIIDDAGRFYNEIGGVSGCMIGWVFLELYERTRRERYKIASQALVEYLIDTHPKSKNGTLVYTLNPDGLLYVDTLPCVCPILARYARRFNAPVARDLAVHQLREFLNRGMDGQSGLPFHGYEVSGRDGLGLLGWARGTGWLAIALVDTLAYLPKEEEVYEEFVQGLRIVIESIKSYQRADGCWSFIIPAPAHTHIDTSGTAMIAYAIEQGLELGVLSSEFSEISRRALVGVISHTTKRGVVCCAQAECGGLGIYPFCFGPASWSQGPATALSALVLARSMELLSNISKQKL